MKFFVRKKKPLLIYVLHSGNLYGTERMALTTIEGMDEYDARVVFAPPPSGNASVCIAAQEAGFETEVFRTRRDLSRHLIRWFLRYRSIDVIGTGAGQSLLCHLLARVLFVELRQLQVAHGGTDASHAYGRKRPLNRIPIKIIAVSEYVKEKLIEHGIRPSSIKVISNFLSDAQRRSLRWRAPYASDQGESLVIDPTHVKVAIVSRVDRIKRIDLLIDAIESQGLGEFQFDIYGTGEELDSLKLRSAALSNVHFHGFRSDIENVLPEADLLLHLCPEEPFGLVILEAFQARLLAVVPDAGGAGGLLEDGVSGFRFHSNDVADLIRVLKVAQNLPPVTHQRMVDAASTMVTGRFSQKEGLRLYREAMRSAGEKSGISS